MMLFLRFKMNSSHYGLASEDIVEIVPWVPLRRIPSAPPGVAGCFKYRGGIIPVIDLSMTTEGLPSKKALSSRIAVVRYDAGKLLGLLLEEATETLQVRKESLMPPCVKTDGARYLGSMAAEDGKIIQLIEPSRLLDDGLRRLLFPDEEEELR